MSLVSSDLCSFLERAKSQRADPAQIARVGRNLVDGALRIRRGADGIYGNVPRPITKPAESIGAWLSSLERDVSRGNFTRSAEMREALVAAAEEVDKAGAAVPGAERLREALLVDAIGGVEHSLSWWRRPAVPWIVAALLGGALVGVLASRRWR